MFGRGHGLIAALSRYLSGQTEENHQNGQDILCPSQDSNLASPEYVLHFFGYICNFQFLSDVRILLRCYLLLLHSRISIVRIQIFRVSVLSRPTRYIQGRFYIWYRIRLQCVFLCAHVFLGISVLLYSRFLCGFLCSVVQFKHVLERTLRMKTRTSIIFPSS